MNTLTINDVFTSWIRRANSENTRVNYSRSVKEFFGMLFEKEIEYIDEEDLMSITPIFVDDNYIDKLKERGLQNSTIIQKMTHVAIFFEKLRMNRIALDKVNYEVIIKDTLSTKNLTNDANGTQEMRIEHKDALIEWYQTERFTGRYADKGPKYAILTEFLFVTGARIQSVFNTKWSDIRYKSDRFGQRAVVIHIVDKGDKTHLYPVSDDFYERLIDVMGEGEGNEKIFKQLSQQGFGRDLITFTKFLKNKDEVDSDADNFTPHSLRSLAITEYHNRNGYDLVKTSRFAGHESVETTRGYVHNDDNLYSQGSYILSSEPVTINDLEGLTKEQLLDMISAKQDVVNYIYNNAKEVGLLK